MIENRPSNLDQYFEVLLEKDRFAYLGCFMQGFLHNANGPLQNMSMLLELLQKELDNQERLLLSANMGSGEIETLLAKQRQRIQQLSSQVETLAEMLRVFMVLKQIEQIDTEIDINFVLIKLSEAFKADLFFKHQVALELQLSRNLPLIQIRGEHILPALVHLVRNAVTALKLSSGRRLLIESRKEDDGVLIHIRDNGCGLQKTVKTESFFEPFTSWWPSEMLNACGEEKSKGYGLYGVRHLLGSYGIDVQLRRCEDGTSATIRIPPALCGKAK
jgi:signal transduction histidine kinase